MKSNIEEKNNQTQEKKFNRKKIVIIITLIALLVAGVIFRGNYLETRELGAEYLNVFWRNTAYLASTIIINFIFLFCIRELLLYLVFSNII